MNEAFYELPYEKQQRIINAGFEIFSQREYKRASTEDIAALSGISKGSLFYYFHNKKSFYMFLFDCALKLVTDNVVHGEYESITDFFEICEYAAQKKSELLEKNPHLMDFVTRAFYSQKEEVSDGLDKNLQGATSKIVEQYFKGVDFSKFKEGVNPLEIMQMLTWMTDGYMHEKQRNHQKINLAEIMQNYRQWSSMLKQISYKEEYLK